MFRKYYGYLLPLLFILACGPAIKFNYDPTINFGPLKTWAWSEQSEFSEDITNNRRPRRSERLLEDNRRSGRSERPLIDRRIGLILEKELIALGYQKVSPSEAQFLVKQYARYKEVPVEYRTRISSGGWGWYPHYGIGLNTSTVSRQTYEEGTVSIEIYDAKTNKLIWEAKAVGALSEIRGPEEADREITRAVKGALDKLPR